MPETTEKIPEPDIFAGAEPDPLQSEDISGDRGDSLEPTPPPAAPETPAAEPAEPEKPVEPPAPEPEKPAEGEKPTEETDHGEPRIPKSRFDQVNERMKRAEARMRELEQQVEAQKRTAPAGETFDFDAAEQKYMEAVVDGEFDKAKSIRNEIRSAERAVLTAEHQVLREQASQQTLQRLEFDRTVAELQSDYPAFDPNAESFDEVLVNEALEVHQGLMLTGRYSASQAIRKAAEMVAKSSGLTAVTAVKAPPATPARETKPDFAGKVATANAQPPTPTRGSKSAPTPNVTEMSESEFDALSEAALRKLRGDIL